MKRSVGRAGELAPDVLRWAQTAGFEALACRDMRHAWPTDGESMRWVEANYHYRKVWVRQHKCMHGCGVSRIQRKDFITKVVKSDYDYPKTEDGRRSTYRLPPGLGRLDSDTIFELNQITVGASKPATVTPVKRARSARKAAIPTPTFSEPARARTRKAG